jgi:hypothetical protein
MEQSQLLMLRRFSGVLQATSDLAMLDLALGEHY